VTQDHEWRAIAIFSPLPNGYASAFCTWSPSPTKIAGRHQEPTAGDHASHHKHRAQLQARRWWRSKNQNTQPRRSALSITGLQPRFKN